MKLIPSRKTPAERAGEMTVVEHLQELRRRLIICVWAVAIAGIAAWFLYGPFKNALRTPYCEFVAENPQNASTNGCDLVVTGDTLGMHLAIGAAVPVVVLFGSTCPQEIELYGRGEKVVTPISCHPCYRKECDITPSCQDLIAVDVVHAACRRVLSSLPSAGPTAYAVAKRSRPPSAKDRM